MISFLYIRGQSHKQNIILHKHSTPTHMCVLSRKCKINKIHLHIGIYYHIILLPIQNSRNFLFFQPHEIRETILSIFFRKTCSLIQFNVKQIHIMLRCMHVLQRLIYLRFMSTQNIHVLHLSFKWMRRFDNLLQTIYTYRTK